MSMLYLA